MKATAQVVRNSRVHFLLAFLLVVSSGAKALVIDLTFDSSVNQQEQAAIVQAAEFWENTFSDPVAVNIEILKKNLSGARAETTIEHVMNASFVAVKSALVTDAKSSVDDNVTQNVLPKLGPGANLSFMTNDLAPDGVTVRRVLDPGPSNNNMFLRVSSANAKALGLLPSDSEKDAEIAFNSGLSFDTDPSDGIGAGMTDLVNLASHEIGHVLGFER